MTTGNFILAADHAAPVLDRVRNQRIVILGDVMLDCYFWGSVSRISPEAPVPIVNVTRESVRLGGAANVAANVRALGARPALVGVLGDDASAEQLKDALRTEDISDAWLTRDPSRPTTRKTRVVAHNQQVVRVDVENDRSIDEPVLDQVFHHVEAALDGAAAMILSDYGKGVIGAALLVRVLAACQARGVPVCVDPKESHFDSYRPISVITPNLLEASQAMGMRVTSDETLEAVGFGLRERLGCPAVLVTRGADGMSLFEAGGEHTHLPAVTQHVFDVTGAGDTVVSVCAAALGAGADHKLAAAIANHAAGLVIREVGTATTDATAILASIGSLGDRDAT